MAKSLLPTFCGFCASAPARRTTRRCSPLAAGRRLLALTVFAAALAEPGLAAKLTDQEHTRIEIPRPADLPDDAALEAAGAVIGRIDIDIRNIFDESDPRERNGLFHLAN